MGIGRRTALAPDARWICNSARGERQANGMGLDLVFAGSRTSDGHYRLVACAEPWRADRSQIDHLGVCRGLPGEILEAPAEYAPGELRKRARRAIDAWLEPWKHPRMVHSMVDCQIDMVSPTLRNGRLAPEALTGKRACAITDFWPLEIRGLRRPWGKTTLAAKQRQKAQRRRV